MKTQGHRLSQLLALLIVSAPLSAANLIVNPKFDSSIDGWRQMPPSASSAVTGAPIWNALDSLRSGNSGSLLLQKIYAGPADATAGQCIAGILEGKRYDVGAKILIPGGQLISSSARASVALTFYSSTDCSGANVTAPSTSVLENYTGGGDFHAISSVVDIPAGAKSVMFQLRTNDSTDPSAFVYAYFDDLIFALAGGCIPNTRPTTAVLCLDEGRFKVSATFATASSPTPSRAQVVQLTSDAGYLWFFQADNVEVTVKVLNACVVNDRHWVFASGLTNVSVVLTVTDTLTGKVKTFTNPLGTAFSPILSVDAFQCP